MKKKIVFVSTTIITVQTFLLDHIQELIKQDFEIYIITNIKKIYNNQKLNVKLINLDFERKISLFSDLLCLFKLFFYLKKISPNLIISITPKAGLLSAFASFFLKIRFRVHIFTGQLWANKKGLYKYFLKFLDEIIVILSTHVLVDSFSQKKFLDINMLRRKRSKYTVIENGSICGVDTNKFRKSYSIRLLLRKKLNISVSSIIITFVGRINYEKGIHNLIDAFKHILLVYKNVYLFLVGHDEIDLKNKLKNYEYRNKIKIFNHNDNVVNFLQTSDIFCLPSQREGFGVSVIEASSCQLPIVCSDIYGLKDSSIHKITGLKFKLGQNKQMVKHLIKLIRDKKLRKKLGKQGRNLVKKKFSKNKVVDGYINFFKKILSNTSY
jgi:glycosyltransferase involved in cell wall biosynthesis